MTPINLDTVHLENGSHTSPDQGACLLEVVSLFAKEPFSDHPACVSPVLRDFGISLNDRWDDATRQELKQFIPLLPGTAGDGQDEARGYLALDWLIRTYTPAWLDLAGLDSAAAELRGLRRIVDMVSAKAAGPVVRSARTQAAAAWAAAGAVAGAVAGDAARDAAGAAAGAVAGAAAGAAAGDAARAVAGAVAWDAARAAAGAAARDGCRGRCQGRSEADR